MIDWIRALRRRVAGESSADGAMPRVAESGLRAILPTPDAPGLLELAMRAHQEGHLEAAESGYREVLAKDPDDIDALHFLGFVAFQRGRLDEAEAQIARALTLSEMNVPARTNLGKVLLARGEVERAIACYRSVLEVAPEYLDARIHLGHALVARGELPEAVACFQSALLQAPDDATLHRALGVALNELGEPLAAAESLRAAIRLDPEAAESHLELGTSLLYLNRLHEANSAYGEALRIRPDFAAAHYNRGVVYRKLHRAAEAIDSFRAALRLDADLAEGWFGLGHAYSDGDHIEEARSSFKRALFLRPNMAQARWSLAMSTLPRVPAAGDDLGKIRSGFARELAALDSWFEGERASLGRDAVGIQQPFALAYHDEDNRDLLQRYGALCARLMVQPSQPRHSPVRTRRRSSAALRVGIVSQHFRNHSVWTAILKGWIGQIDQRRIAVHAFYLGSKEDAETAYAKAHTAGFTGGPRKVEQWIASIEKLQPDVLIYPEIGMEPMALKLASLRLAPVQVAAWGHPETTGLPTIDYYLSAQDLEPLGAQAHYSERLVALPRLGVYLDPVRVEPELPDLSRWGVEDDVPLFVCAGTPFKYAPARDRVFTDIARQLGNCRFLFFEHWTAGLSARLRRRLESVFEDAGLDFDRHVRFIPWQPRSTFHGVMRRADAYLDTIGFSGFNTALQAIDCELPIVAFQGRFLRGRLASGILNRARLPDLVTETDAGYVALAARLIEDDAYRGAVRNRMRAARESLHRDLAPIRALEEFLVRAADEIRA